jgi:hypothetical protein
MVRKEQHMTIVAFMAIILVETLIEEAIENKKGRCK